MTDRSPEGRGMHRSVISLGFLCALLLFAGSTNAVGLGPIQGGALPGPLPLFPADNWWNVDISAAPIDPNSTNFINFVGVTRGLHPDFGGEVSPGSAQVYGMPYAVVDGTQPKVQVNFVLYPGQSDGVGVAFYPIPTQAIMQPHWIEEAIPAPWTFEETRTGTSSSWTATTSTCTSSTTSSTTPRQPNGKRARAPSST